MSKTTFVMKMTLAVICASGSLSAASQPSSSQFSKPTWNQGSSAATPPSTHAEAPKVSPFIPRQPLPQMIKPFGMPGVIGVQNGKWAGTDFLGYVSSHISIDVEILKGENTPSIPDVKTLTEQASAILTKENLVPKADAFEGPLLPFLHILLIVYPVDKDKFVVFGTCRLFEQIQVMRKNFSPAGFWQGITWENQDINLTTAEHLNDQIKSTVDKLVRAFVERYRIYNPLYESPPSPNPLP